MKSISLRKLNAPQPTGDSQPLCAIQESANAQKSTGPTSSTGREAVSRNRATHGLCGRFTVLSNEHQAAFDAMFERFLQNEKPVDDVERELVLKMARHTWLSDRAQRYQDACFLIQPQTEEDMPGNTNSVATLKDIDIYVRYQAHHDRAYARAAAELLKRRKDRDLSARGFESQKRAEAETKDREKRQNQRDELHSYRVANAKMHLERKMERCGKPNLYDFGARNTENGKGTTKNRRLTRWIARCKTI